MKMRVELNRKWAQLNFQLFDLQTLDSPFNFYSLLTLRHVLDTIYSMFLCSIYPFTNFELVTGREKK